VVKRSTFTLNLTAGKDGGSSLLDRVLFDVKKALDELAARVLTNVAENGGVLTISAPVAAPDGRPGAGEYWVWIDRTDGKLYSRGSNGTDTVIGTP
jgi:hypothetical protein